MQPFGWTVSLSSCQNSLISKRWYLYMGMDQYLLIPFLGGWTSIYQLFWCSPGVLLVLTHCHIPMDAMRWTTQVPMDAMLRTQPSDASLTGQLLWLPGAWSTARCLEQAELSPMALGTRCLWPKLMKLVNQFRPFCKRCWLSLLPGFPGYRISVVEPREMRNGHWPVDP